MTGQVYVLGTQPISQPAGPAYAIPAGAAGTVLASQGPDQPPAFVTAPGSTPAGAAGAVQYNDAGAFGGVGPGTARQFLITPSPAGPPVWAGASGVRLTNSVNQASAGSFTAVSFDTEVYDTDTYHAGGSPTRITIPFDGLYIVGGNCNFSGGGFIGLQLMLNGTTTFANASSGVVTAAGTGIAITTVAHFVAGDFIELMAAASAAGNITAASDSPFFFASYLGPIA